MTMTLALHPAAAHDRSVVANLIQLHLYDMASETPFDLADTGLYNYDYLEAFWRYP